MFPSSICKSKLNFQIHSEKAFIFYQGLFSDAVAYGAYSDFRAPEFLQYFSSTIVNLIPVIFVVIIDSTILVVELSTELENHKSSFLKNISLMLKYGMFLFSAYWIPIFILFSGMMPSLIQMEVNFHSILLQMNI